MKSRFNRMGPARAAMQRERLLIFGGGTVMVALIVVVGLLMYGQSTVDAKEQVVAEAPINEELAFGTVVLIAPVAEVASGTKLSKVPLREMYWPRDKVPEGAVRSMDDVQEMFAKGKLTANQPILRSDLSAAPLSLGIQELLPPGHRAVTIEVSATSGVEGWATPGAHVDVLLTYMDSKDGVNKTRVAVEDAIVLSYDGSTKKVSNAAMDTTGRFGIAAPSPQRTSTVTLAVTFEDTLKIQTARAMGRIALALRNSTDVKSTGAGVFSAEQFDRTQARTGATAQPNGFAKYRDSTGNERHFVLSPDSKWWASEENDN